MRGLPAAIVTAASLGLAGCGIERLVTVAECAKGFEQSEDDVPEARIRAACTCAVERQMAAGDSHELAGAGTPMERRAYRNHIPACLAANGGSATGTLARESQGPPRRTRVYDPAAGGVTDPNPPLPLMPGAPGTREAPAPAPLQAAPLTDPGQIRPAPVPVAAANMAIIRNRSGQALQCGRAGEALERIEIGEFDVAPGPYYCAYPVQPPSFALQAGRTYDIGPFALGELPVHDVTGQH